VKVATLFISWITVVAAAVGVLLGAAIASAIWSRRARRTRQDFSFSMRKRAAQAEKLRDQFAELQERLRHHDEQTIELTTARHDLAALKVELEQARATMEDAQRALDTARADAADAESRFASQLESERLESAERRHHVESELEGARNTMLALQDEVATARANAQRTIDRLETDLDATRVMLHQASESLRSEREAGVAMRDELRAQASSADWERQRAEAELVEERRQRGEERRQWSEKLAATQPYIATMREQYLLAAAERDAIVKELTAQRERAQEGARAIEQTRAEFALALDEEHRTAMELLNRAWRYVQTFPRIPDSWSRSAPRTMSHPDDMPPPPPYRSAPAAPAHAPAFTESESRIEVEHAADRAPSPSPAADGSDYDIEAELADAIAEDLDARSFVRNRKPRRPIGTVKLGNETVVVCDDGSSWRKSERGWRQVTPLPGSPVQSRESRIERAG